MKTLEWFTSKVGTSINAKSNKGYNGEMLITDAEHASYLFHVAQNKQGYTFTEL